MKKKRKINKFSVIGKYIDTPTKTEIKVINFFGEAGQFKVSLGNLQGATLKSCRFTIKMSDAKRKIKFFKRIKAFLDLSAGWKDLDKPEPFEMPLLFGLLKLRKNKERKFVLIEAADNWYKGKTISIVGIVLDNLIYLDLVNRLKNKE